MPNRQNTAKNMATPSTTMAKPHWEAIRITSDTDLKPFTAAQFASFYPTNNVMHDALYPPPASTENIASAAQRHRDNADKNIETTHYTQILDTTEGPGKGIVAGGAVWQIHPNGTQRPPKIPLTWVGEEGSEGREFAQGAMDAFHGRRVEVMGGPHVCMLFPLRQVPVAFAAFLVLVDRETTTDLQTQYSISCLCIRTTKARALRLRCWRMDFRGRMSWA